MGVVRPGQGSGPSRGPTRPGAGGFSGAGGVAGTAMGPNCDE